jgi:hypothetical protein
VKKVTEDSKESAATLNLVAAWAGSTRRLLRRPWAFDNRTGGGGFETKWLINRVTRDKLHHRLSCVSLNPSWEMALAVDQSIIGSMCEI